VIANACPIVESFTLHPNSVAVYCAVEFVMLPPYLYVAENILQENCNPKLETYNWRSHDHLRSSYATMFLIHSYIAC